MLTQVVEQPVEVPTPTDWLSEVDLLEALCTCGHLYPEHSIFGTCRGCTDCSDHDEDHPYEQCHCREFLLSEMEEA